jgi:hypothetical protein
MRAARRARANAGCVGRLFFSSRPHQSSIFLEAALEVTVLLLSARRLIGSGFQRTQAWGGDDVADLEPCEVHCRVDSSNIGLGGTLKRLADNERESALVNNFLVSSSSTQRHPTSGPAVRFLACASLSLLRLIRNRAAALLPLLARHNLTTEGPSVQANARGVKSASVDGDECPKSKMAAKKRERALRYYFFVSGLPPPLASGFVF